MKGLLRRLRIAGHDAMSEFLGDVSGVIHIGAHTGQERELYARHGLEVLWVEPLPELFEALERNLQGFAKQRAIRALITDKAGEEYPFHVSSNAGASSSLLELKLHKDVWPDVTYTRTIQLKSETLVSLLQANNIDSTRYDALILDTQGSELLVLTGAAQLLGGFKYIQAEVADFEAYENCCQIDDVAAFLAEHGFVESARRVISTRPQGGAYYDIVYRKS